MMNFKERKQRQRFSQKSPMAGFEYAETVWISKMIGRVYSGKRFYGVTYQALWICIDPIFGGTPSDYQACVFRDSSVTYQIASLFSMNDSNNETF